ncbi:MAG: hypothetical protein EA376_01220 [Phycisphaeraceae bacterium]|nr:MAG: hypothetical protein EA376_01220 [Phycisphaeraceae bacterium]
MSAIVELADAITASLNGQTFDPPVTAERSHLPIFDLGKVGDNIQLSIVPRSATVSPASRASNFFDLAIDIGVQKRIDPEAPAQIDALLDLVEQIGDHLRLKRLDTMPEAQWLTSEHEPVLAAEHIERFSVFTSVLTVTYRIAR